MTQLDTASFVWEIENFANIRSLSESKIFATKQAKFWISFYPMDIFEEMHDHIAIYLRQGTQITADLKVFWSISLINRKGEEYYPKVREMNYSVESGFDSIEDALFRLDRNTILDASNGLLPGGKLFIKCTVTIFDCKNSTGNIDEKKITLAPKKARANYESLLESAKLSDVVFVIGEKEFKLHKAILASQSPVFSAMFENDMEEAKQNLVEITDVDVEVFDAMIRFIYMANVDSVKHYALDLFVAADKYQLDSLMDICADYLGSNLTIESVANILLVADMHTAQELKSKCVQYIKKNVGEVIATDGWKELTEINAQLVVEVYCEIANK